MPLVDVGETSHARCGDTASWFAGAPCDAIMGCASCVGKGGVGPNVRPRVHTELSRVIAKFRLACVRLACLGSVGS